MLSRGNMNHVNGVYMDDKHFGVTQKKLVEGGGRQEADLVMEGFVGCRGWTLSEKPLGKYELCLSGYGEARFVF